MKNETGADASRRRGDQVTLTSTDRKAAALLVAMGPVRYISAFGEQMLRRGVVRAELGKRYKPQACALLAGKQLNRLRRLGLAQDRYPYGFLPTNAAKRLAADMASKESR